MINTSKFYALKRFSLVKSNFNIYKSILPILNLYNYQKFNVIGFNNDLKYNLIHPGSNLKLKILNNKFFIDYKKNKERFFKGFIKTRELWEKYRYFGVFTYISVYLITLFSFWAMIIKDVIKFSDLLKIISFFRLENHFDLPSIRKRIESPYGKLFLAWISTKIVEPIRLILTLAITPHIYKIFSKLY